MQAFAIGSRHTELGAGSEHRDGVSGEPRLHFDDAIDVDDVAPVDANEGARIELRLDAGRRAANQMTRRADVQAYVIAVGLPPIDVGDANDLEDAIDTNRDAIQRILRRLNATDVVGEQCPNAVVISA